MEKELVDLQRRQLLLYQLKVFQLWNAVKVVFQNGNVVSLSYIKLIRWQSDPSCCQESNPCLEDLIMKFNQCLNKYSNNSITFWQAQIKIYSFSISRKMSFYKQLFYF